MYESELVFNQLLCTPIRHQNKTPNLSFRAFHFCVVFMSDRITPNQQHKDRMTQQERSRVEQVEQHQFSARALSPPMGTF